MRIRYSMIIVFVAMLVSCKKNLDINTNPVAATSVSPDLLFNYALVSWSSNRTGGDSYIPIAFHVQNQASGGNYGWGASDVYDISPFSTGNTWRGYYATSGNNLKLAITQAEAAVPKNNNAAAQCKIVLAQMMYECTTIWGDIPFSESWNTAISYPKFDAQKDVLEGIIKLLDEAIAQIETTSPLKIGSYDLLYKGDMVKWKKLANSLKFRTLMLMVDKDPTKASKIGEMLTNGGMIDNSNVNMLYPYLNESGKENPKFKILKRYAGSQNVFFFANTNVFDYMDPYDDPRIPVYFAPGTDADPDEYIAVESEAEADETTAVINIATLLKPDAPDLMFTYQEQLFFEAEAYARGLGVAVNLTKADELYRKGITEALKYYGIGATAITNYLAAMPSLTTAAKPLQEIYMQQWIDLMDRPLEAFTQWRRSGPEGSEFPELTQPAGTPAGGFLRRWDYPQSAELIPNQNAPKVSPPFTTKLWFDL
ncbi:MAG: SusD/RagB family nutrient-binding outer membrane lipoprotein [Lacibacter sp.]